MSTPSPDNPIPLRTSPAAIVYPILALISCLVLTPPLLLQIRARSLPLIVLFLCFILQNFFNFLNAIIWHDDDIPHWWNGKILCDVEVKLQYGFYQAVLGAPPSLLRYLTQLLNTERATIIPSPKQKRIQLTFEVALCIVLPAIVVASEIVVQSKRYFIYGLVGCQTLDAIDWLSFVLLQSWQIDVCAIGLFYSGLIMYRLYQYRRQISSLLGSQQFNISQSRFKRLFLLSNMLVLYDTVYICVTIALNTGYKVGYHFDWNDVHRPGWSTNIEMYYSYGLVPIKQWLQVSTGFALFLLLGTGQDANKMYKEWMTKLKFDKLATMFGWLWTRMVGRQIENEFTTEMQRYQESGMTRDQPCTNSSISHELDGQQLIWQSSNALDNA